MSEVIRVANCEEVDRTGDVVFVHGLDGHSIRTWQSTGDRSTFWPDWLGKELPRVGIWSLGFEASSSKWKGSTMDVVDRATNLLAQLQASGLGVHPLIFVAHSLGGLIVKQLLRQGMDYGNAEWKRISTATVGILFLATPHAGSTLASFAKYFRLLYLPTASVDDLCADDPNLRDLNTWYRSNASSLGIDTVVFRETMATHGIFVVSPSSSDPGLQGVVPIPIDGDHVAICKPTSRSSVVYQLTKQFVEQRLAEITIGSRAVSCPRPDIFVDIGINNAYPPWPYISYEQLEEDEDYLPRTDERTTRPSETVQYGISRDNASLIISAEMPYLNHLRRGGPIYGLEYAWSPFRWQFPNLDFKGANNSGETVYLTEAIFCVESSELDPIPLPVIPRKSCHSMQLVIENEGWGAMNDVLLKANLFPTDHGEDYDTPFLHRFDLGNVEEQHVVDLADAFASLGVDIERCEDGDRPPLVRTGGFGPFENGWAILCGVLSYSHLNTDGEKDYVAVKVGTLVGLTPPPLGLYTPPSYQYDAVFEVGKKEYEVRVPISQTLRLGEADRFNIRIAAEKSSRHKFHVQLMCNGTALPMSCPITLSLLLHRSQWRLKAMPGDMRSPL